MVSAESVAVMAFVTSSGSALLITPLLRRWALARGCADFPGPRKIHTRPVPRLGGLGLFVAFLAGLLWLVAAADTSPLLNGLLTGGGIIFFTGLYDDLRGMTARRKFAGEIAACLAGIAASGLWVGDLGDLCGLGRVVLPAWAGVPFTVFAVVGVINAVNLIDGLDGLAGVLSVIALAAFGVLGLLAGDSVVVLICLSLAGAILGFLCYNLRPAHIFMGDAGSLTIGFLLSFLAIHLTQQGGVRAEPMTPLLVLALPICDALRVMVMRICRGQSPCVADRTHIHHRLLDLGFSQRATLSVLMLIAVVAAVAGIAGRHWPAWTLLLVMIAGVLSVALLLVLPPYAGRVGRLRLTVRARKAPSQGVSGTQLEASPVSAFVRKSKRFRSHRVSGSHCCMAVQAVATWAASTESAGPADD